MNKDNNLIKEIQNNQRFFLQNIKDKEALIENKILKYFIAYNMIDKVINIEVNILTYDIIINLTLKNDITINSFLISYLTFDNSLNIEIENRNNTFKINLRSNI